MGSPVHFKIIGNIVYAEPAEFMNISKSEVDALHEVVKTKISGNFGLIDIRPSTTSIDPMVYRYAKERMPQFTAYALVAESDLTSKFFEEIEKPFIKDIQFAIFRTVGEAEVWMKTVLANEGKS